jgi:predicted phage-related endonuclease
VAEVKLSSKKVKEALATLIAVKEQMKALEQQKEQAENILKEAIGDNDRAIVAGVGSYSMRAGSNTWFDRKLMETTYPEAFAKCLRTTEYKALRVG